MAGSVAQADWSSVALGKGDFVAKVREEGARLYRDLPWRNVRDPYAVLVSEVMLQQTQVARVVRYWQRWMSLFPTVDALAAADTALVLETWQGLGYNRRALALKRACETCSAERQGVLPQTVDELVALPGVGPATAAGVVAFAHDKPCAYLETNVRSVFLHELFPQVQGVSDKQLLPYVQDACPDAPCAAEGPGGVGHVAGTQEPGGAPGGAWGPRAWYYALLDYGAHLKSQVTNPSRRSAHHTRQSKFEGSHREKRSFVLKQVLAAPEGVVLQDVHAALDEHERAAGRVAIDVDMFQGIVDELVSEGFFRLEGGLLVP